MQLPEFTSIDATFDFRSDTPRGKDPDAWSPALRRSHQIAWSKELPSGRQFLLATDVPGAYLSHKSDLGDWVLTSDSVIPTYSYWKRMQPIVAQMDEAELEHFESVGYTFGGMMVFPGTARDGVRTINGERGLNRRIGDRMDLTLECVRRHYDGEDSPMSATLSAYGDFFDLFGSFGGYVNFFLLSDLVSSNGDVTFFLPFDGFEGSPLPKSVEEYRQYMNKSIEFVQLRNLRFNRAA